MVGGGGFSSISPVVSCFDLFGLLVSHNIEKYTVVLCFGLLDSPLGQLQMLYVREKFPFVSCFDLFGLLVSPKIDMFTKNPLCFRGLALLIMPFSNI